MFWQPSGQSPAQNGFGTGGGNYESSPRNQSFQNRDQGGGGGGGRQPTADVYICNIPADMNEDQLTTIFSEAGEVQGVTILPVKDGRETAIGFVKYRAQEEADRAIQQLNGYQVGDQQLSVRVPRSKAGGGQQRDGGGQQYGGNRQQYGGERRQFGGSGQQQSNGQSPFSPPQQQQNSYQMNGFHNTQETHYSPAGRGAPQPPRAQPVTEGFSQGMGRGYPSAQTNYQQSNHAGAFQEQRGAREEQYASPSTPGQTESAPFTGTVQRSAFQPRVSPQSAGMGRGSAFQSTVPPSRPSNNWGTSNGSSETFTDQQERRCFKCQQPGHMANDCPSSQERRGGGACHKCGEEGHFARECPNAESTGRNSCHRCGQEGHFARDCPSGGRSGGGACHRCGQEGHFARECPNSSEGLGNSCHHCGEEGHFARECPKRSPERGGSRGGSGCHHCGQEGHFARECPERGSGGGGSGCHRCGQEGHIARDCPERGDSGGSGCHHCGQEGHFARECPERGGSGGGGSGCHRCGEEGHFARECPNPPTDGRPPPVTYVPEDLPNAEEMFAQMENFGINFDQYDSIPVNVTGNNPIPGIEHFEEAGLYEVCARNIKRANYMKPTPVQKRAIPIILQGRDLMACAQTGSGKTAAFLLPVMTHMLNQGLSGMSMLSGGPQKPLAVIIAPTRELVVQIYNEVRKFCDGSIIRPVVCYGGVSVNHQLNDLSRGCHILVATPGRLDDFVSRERVSFEMVRYLILDEADRMLDMGFERAVRKLIQGTNMPDKMNRQTLMFSATFPEEIQRLAGDFLNDYLFLTVGRVGGSNMDIKQVVIQVPADRKREKLVELLTAAGVEKTLIFVERKRASDFLASFLSQNDFPTTSISGDRDQREREAALVDFKQGRAPFLVATAVAARGLDIPNVKHVINFDLPQEIDEYVHRIGRTGRIGKHGKATSFYDADKDSKLARSLVKMLSDAKQEVPSWLEDAAEGAIGSSYGPAGGRFGARDRRERAPMRTSPGGAPPQQNHSQMNGSSGHQSTQAAADDDEDWD